MRIEEIDRNFKVPSVVTDEDVEWISALDPRFSISGVYYSDEEERFIRLPREVAARANDGVKNLSSYSTGGRIRFVSDSPYIAIRAVIVRKLPMQHMTIVNQNGFSIYSERGYHAMLGPSAEHLFKSESRVAYEGIKRFGKNKRSYTLYMPSYGEVCSLFIGLQKGSLLEAARPYKNAGAPVAFYGSSITEGAHASRPCNAYTALLSARLDTDYYNFGFSGSAKGDLDIAEYICSLEISALVIDYDHNAPDPDFLRKTHAPFFRYIREQKPSLPILLTTRPNFEHTPDAAERRAIVRATYESALSKGDKNVYFLDGESFYGRDERYLCTTDTTHPNDIGHERMARAYEATLAGILDKP